MESMIDFLRTDLFLVLLSGVSIVLFILVMVNSLRISKMKKGYLAFMKKLGNGKDLQEDLLNYANAVKEVEKKTGELINYCKMLDLEIANCVQKVGIVRYSAFKDTGSDLSFALALLDEKNNGVVLNGIYSREMSNIYAKPIEEGTSKSYTLSEEELQAIQKAIHSDHTYRVR